jgi:hypothetical protein
VDASAIIQNDASIENVRAMTEAALEFGAYGAQAAPAAPIRMTPGIPKWAQKGICASWENRSIPGDMELVQRIWDENEGLAYLFIWHILLSF